MVNMIVATLFYAPATTQVIRHLPVDGIHRGKNGLKILPGVFGNDTGIDKLAVFKSAFNFALISKLKTPTNSQGKKLELSFHNKAICRRM